MCHIIVAKLNVLRGQGDTCDGLFSFSREMERGAISIWQPCFTSFVVSKKGSNVMSVYACVLPVRNCAAFWEIWEAIDSNNAVRNQTVKLDV